MTLSEFIPKPNIYESNNECEFDLVSPNSVEEDKRPDKTYICELAINHPDKVKIYRKSFDKRSNKELYNLYKFNVIKHSKTTLTFDNGRTFKKHSFCIRVKDSVHPNDIPDEIMNEVVLEFNKTG